MLSYLCWSQLHIHHTGMCSINLLNSWQKKKKSAQAYSPQCLILSAIPVMLSNETEPAPSEESRGILQLRTPLFINLTLQSLQAPLHRPVSLLPASIRWHLCFYMRPGNPPLSLCLRAFWHANDRQLVFIRVPFCSDWGPIHSHREILIKCSGAYATLLSPSV